MSQTLCPSRYPVFMTENESVFGKNTNAIQYVCHIVSCAIILPAFLFEQTKGMLD